MARSLALAPGRVRVPFAFGAILDAAATLIAPRGRIVASEAGCRAAQALVSNFVNFVQLGRRTLARDL